LSQDYVIKLLKYAWKILDINNKGDWTTY